ncbi:SPOR domain-containing protein [Rhodoligotrophos defluvii]|uniref:SPOR domain-containing protein n=1 Tax=Rhodoligotrophos defluvii TaxID=2561934 RepID=UPI001485B697|nr:tetratricopeptide repeat protein [Rhodoligotrophos defluvii]
MDPASANDPVAKLASAASEALRKGDLRQAIEQYTAIIGTPGVPKADKVRAELNRGLAYQRQGLHAKAAEDYSNALKADVLDARKRSIALYNRGLAYRKLNQPGLAVEDFTAALFLNPEFAEAYMSRGLVMREHQKPYYALSDFHKAIESAFDRPHLAYFARAMVFEELGRPDDAKNELARALMTKPDFAEARDKLAALGGSMPASVAGQGQPAISSASQRVATLSTPAVTGSVGASVEGQADAGGDSKAMPKAAVPPAHLLDDTGPRARKQAMGTDAHTSARLVATTSDGGTAQPVKVASAEAGLVASDAVPSSPVIDQSKGAQAVAAAAPTGWLIQLSSAQSEDSAWGVWKKLSAKHDDLNDFQPVVIRADLGAKGVFYRLRVAGFDTRNEADKACRSLKSRGLSCFVTKAE